MWVKYESCVTVKDLLNNILKSENYNKHLNENSFNYWQITEHCKKSQELKFWGQSDNKLTWGLVSRLKSADLPFFSTHYI